MKSSEKLKEFDQNLLEEYSSMSKEELLEQICAEVIDLIRMNERVSFFMDRCTLNMSDTRYTIESIETLINQKQEYDINEFCSDLSEMSNEDATKIITDRTERYLS